MAMLFATTTMGQEENEWKAKLESSFQAYKQPGAEAMVAVLSKDKIVYAQAFYDSKEVDLNQQQILQTPFALNLMSKPFTTMAIMQLVDKGKIALTDPITKYLSLNEKFGNVKIYNLMNHTSGISSLETLPGNYQSLISELNVSQKDAVEANKSWGYSNVDYPLLGALIEKASGRSYAAYMHKRIFRKAKMEASGIAGDENTPATIGAIDLAGERGVYTTFSDMAKWNGALYTNRLLDCEQMADIFSVDTLANGSKVPYYGYGWVLMERNGLKYYWLGSGEEGHNHLFVHYPQKRVTIVIITKGENRENLLKKAMEILPLIPREELVWE